ncbi:hypothetical protein ACH5RR_026658 [Cinchona calisaya]|uniref:Transposase n=1 Tax=Cinchona calisaya TaxID=153742 RepID=A0ABD2Z538_9GENT
MRCYHWGKCKHEPSATYEGGEITVFDEVELLELAYLSWIGWWNKLGYTGTKGKDGMGDKNARDRSDEGVGFGGTKDVRNRSDEGAGAKDYEEEHDDEEYEDNVDHEAKWLVVAKQIQMMAERAKENQAIKITRNEDEGLESDVDNSDKDDVANCEAEFESLHGSDKEQGMQYPVFDPKDINNPNLEVGMVFSSFRKFKAAVRSWNIKRGRSFKVVKSDKIRVRAGPLGGMLPTVVGIDPNNGFFPIAYAACEGENKDSRAWFLNLLKEDLMIERDYESTLMSDKQRGIIQACEAVETYLRCYEPTIIPLYGEQDWEKTNAIAPLPPTYGRLPGRLKKCRRKGEDEMTQRRERKKKIRRFGQVIKCTYCSEKGHNIRSCKLRKENEAAKDVDDSPTQDGEGTIHGVDHNQVREGTQEAPSQGEAQGTQDTRTIVTQEPSAAAVSKSTKRSKVSKRTREWSRNSEACVISLKRHLLKGMLQELRRHGEGTQEAAMKDTQETAIGAAFGHRVVDAFNRLYDALETLTCSVPAKEPDLFQVFGIEKSVTTHNSQPSKGKRNSQGHMEIAMSLMDDFCLGIAFVWE